MSGTLTLNGAAAGDTSYKIDFTDSTGATGNSVGTLVANLGASAGGVGLGSLTYVDDNPVVYTLGNITAKSVTLDEVNNTSALIRQAGNTSIRATTLTLNGDSSGVVDYALGSLGNSVGTLTANLGTSPGGVGTGETSLRPNQPRNSTPGFALGTITTGIVALQENAASGTISQAPGSSITTSDLLLSTAFGSNLTYTLTGTGNSVGTLAAASINNLSFTDNGGFSMGPVGGVSGISGAGSVTLEQHRDGDAKRRHHGRHPFRFRARAAISSSPARAIRSARSRRSSRWRRSR